MKNRKLFLIYGAAGIIAATVFVLPVTTKLFSTYDLFFQMCAAVLGVVLSAVITFILLWAQSSKEMQQEREAKVYEQKLAVCKDFLELLRNVLEDGTVTPEEVNSLKFAFANVALHISNQMSLVRVSSYLKQIVDGCGPGKREVEGSVVCNTLKIVTVLREEIYGSKGGKEKKITLDDLIQELANEEEIKLEKEEITTSRKMPLEEGNEEKNEEEKASDFICERLSGMLENTNAPEAAGKESDGVQNAEDSPRLRILQAVKAKLEAAIDKELWTVSCPDALEITCLKEGLDTKDAFVIRLTHEGEDRHYYQCHLNFTDAGVRRAHYLRMRAKFGGGFNKYGWWCYVDDQTQRTLASTEATATDLTCTVDTCCRRLKDVVDYMTVYLATRDKLQSIAADLGISAWSLFVWENTIMIFENTALKFRIAAKRNDDDSISNVRVWLNDGCPDHVQQKLREAIGREPENGGYFTVCDRCDSRSELEAKIKTLGLTSI